MLDFPRWKVYLICIVCIASIITTVPSFMKPKTLENLPNWFPKTSVNLGLDLRGGSHLLLEIDFNNYINEQLEILKDTIRKEFREKKLGYINLSTSKDFSVKFKLRNLDEMALAKKLLNNISKDLDVSFDKDNFSISYKQDYLKFQKNKVLEQSIEIIRRRVDETGTREPIIQKQGTDYILLQVPGLQNPDHLKNLLGQTAKLTFHIVNYDASTNGMKAPFGSVLLKGEKRNKDSVEENYVIYKKSLLSGELLTDAKASFDDRNNAVVSFSFNTLGAKKFAEITKRNAGKALAIVLDNKVISAPVINEPILGGSGIIKGNFSVKTANDLALLLRAGALPAPLEIVEERTVGPSLGSDSIDAGKTASLIGIAAVMIFMFLSYGLFGMFANIALMFNLLFIISILSVLQATLTMPGIAGIVLTMGMAVDANVLIFERIREESKLGMSSFATIDRGFRQAFSTILDSNMTTIFAAISLYFFGSGAVKGFAVTLIIGILTSMFSSITITRFMVVKWLRITKPKSINI